MPPLRAYDGDDDRESDLPTSTSGVMQRAAYRPFPASDTLGAAVLIAAQSVGVDKKDDDAASVCFAVGESALRGVAWLRARGAAVGHAASRSRLTGDDGTAYKIAQGTRVSRHSDKRAFTVAAIRSAQIAEWLRPDRVAIVLVGPAWAHAIEEQVRALVVVGAAMGSLVLFDPSGDGSLEEAPFHTIDLLRAHPDAAWEVLLAARRP